ncbi:3-oxoadipate enol-lactonase [Aliiroseovarius subalbicans]|uniref:3-oxoadipate enol-lactonase n=1 Tax=Aliiroseovarius subalbicans TaxID=2925840 RepID=UPI001F581812|nr:3-oxoadipate enol-lactonase [Aliiroseovarius subalbicans]MCI2400260.1 3-oxoadipate enol-lactonase [Aliiroseovarius subalbicans]
MHDAPPDFGTLTLHHEETGPTDDPVLVLAHALGANLRIWDGIMPHLPDGLRVIRMDMRGHGASPCPEGPYYMGDLVADAARLLDRLAVKDCVFVGLSIGGMIAQGLAAERLDLVRAMVLSNTAAKIGTPAIWQDRIDAIRAGGIEAVVEPNMERWFSRASHRDQPEMIETARTRLRATPLEGYLGCCAAIAETDLYDSTARLTLPTLAIAGSEDGSTPADLVRETAGLIPGARFELMRGCAHMAPVEKPAEYAALLTTFLRGIGHV